MKAQAWKNNSLDSFRKCSRHLGGIDDSRNELVGGAADDNQVLNLTVDT